MSEVTKSSTAPTKRELVSRGLLAGQDNITVSGVNPDIDMNSTPETIWNLPGQSVYQFSTDGTAPINKISSSNIGDTQTICIKGLIANGDELNQFVTLDGQNKVDITPIGRHNIMTNESEGDLLGDVYVYEDVAITNGVPNDLSLVRGFISIGDNRSLQGVFTVPNNKIALISSVYPILIKQKSAEVLIQFETKRFGKAKQVTIPVGINSSGTSFLPVIFDPPRRIKGRTDMIPTIMKSSDNDVGVSIVYTFDLIDQLN